MTISFYKDMENSRKLVIFHDTVIDIFSAQNWRSVVQNIVCAMFGTIICLFRNF